MAAEYQTAYKTIASLMVLTMYFTSASVTQGPVGKQIPALKMDSETPFR